MSSTICQPLVENYLLTEPRSVKTHGVWKMGQDEPVGELTHQIIGCFILPICNTFDMQ